MKNLGKFAVLGAVLAVSSSFAFADQIGSYATGQATMGNVNSALNYAGFVLNNGALNTFVTDPSADITSGTNSSVLIGAGSPWANAQTNSTWVSFEANTNPASTNHPTNVAAQGYYTFTTTFSETVGGVYTVNLSLLADDTLAVYFNNGSGNLLKLAAGPVGDDAACADGAGAVNCETPTLLSFNSVLTGSTTNTLTFVVEQTGYQDFGLDFTGSVVPSSTPEPSSLMLLGTGLVGAAGSIFRRRRATV